MIKKFSTDSSSVIKEVTYNTELNNMRIIFKSGSSYIYQSVPEKVFNELITAESMGKYFGMYIKDRYIFTKMSTEEFAALNEAVRILQSQNENAIPDLFSSLTNLINEA